MTSTYETSRVSEGTTDLVLLDGLLQGHRLLLVLGSLRYELFLNLGEVGQLGQFRLQLC